MSFDVDYPNRKDWRRPKGDADDIREKAQSHHYKARKLVLLAEDVGAVEPPTPDDAAAAEDAVIECFARILMREVA